MLLIMTLVDFMRWSHRKTTNKYERQKACEV